MKISKKDENMLLKYTENRNLSLKEVIMVLESMSKDAVGLEYAALTQAVDYLKKVQYNTRKAGE